MKKTNYKYLFFSFFVFSLLKITASSFYLNDSFNVLYFTKYSSFIEFKQKGDSVYFTYRNKREVGYPTEAATKSNFLSVTYSKYYTSNLVAKAEYFTRNKKGKLKKHKVRTFYDKQITSEGIFYEDLMQKTCFFQNLNTGSKSSLEYSYDGTDPVIVPKMMFNFDIPAAEVFYEIIIPNNLQVKFSFFGDSSGINHKIIQKDKFVIHQYTSFNRDAIVREEESESMYYYVPHLYIIPVSYTANNKSVNLCGSIENLAKYYSKHINVVKDENNPAIDKLTDSIISGITD
ncbi:MAG: DUF3857 domain-containing protein, partial [Bacteroidia bacterium]|nr:DUF3857 domain-containing protein [Bacteroidia bacterium]